MEDEVSPMLFCLENRVTKRKTHCGVLEFVAKEGQAFLPYWVCYFAAGEGRDIREEREGERERDQMRR